MFEKSCKEATKVIAPENPEDDLDEEESYEFEENELPHDIIYDMRNSYFGTWFRSNMGGLSEDYQIVVNVEQGLIYNMLFHARKLLNYI